MSTQLFTIGVYGFSEQTFFEALQSHQIDTLVDVRQRRGVRGKSYAFANHKRLTKQLLQQGMAYVHLPELAPNAAMREIAHIHDKNMGTSKRARMVLPETFCMAYYTNLKETHTIEELLAKLPPRHQKLVFLCVETHPEACHRHLITDWMATEAGLPVTHILPPP
ncbi:MAG: DUF488 domain-containing protein [Rhodothermia bacterium]|nr:DUF488 domain-containing protein [Rhodothermia bacterium]